MAFVWSILLTTAVMMLCTLLHYEVVSRLDRFARVIEWPTHAVLVGVLAALTLTHVVEIGIYAASYGLADMIRIGGLRGSAALSTAEYFIFAAETYSSLGSADVVPQGEIRLMASLSPLNGILMLAWSASFLFSLVERWRAPRAER